MELTDCGGRIIKTTPDHKSTTRTPGGNLCVFFFSRTLLSPHSLSLSPSLTHCCPLINSLYILPLALSPYGSYYLYLALFPPPPFLPAPSHLSALFIFQMKQSFPCDQLCKQRGQPCMFSHRERQKLCREKPGHKEPDAMAQAQTDDLWPFVSRRVDMGLRVRLCVYDLIVYQYLCAFLHVFTGCGCFQICHAMCFFLNTTL